jgi:hypothetical protein
MKLRALIAVFVLAAAVGSAGAQETMLINPDTDGCQLYAPYSWVELAPGQKWTTMVDLAGCSASDLGWFRFYGHLGTNSSCNTLKVKDGVALSVVNLADQVSYLPATAGSQRDEEFVLLQVDQPTRFQLSALNTSRQRVKVRMTWLSMAGR